MISVVGTDIANAQVVGLYSGGVLMCQKTCDPETVNCVFQEREYFELFGLHAA